MYLFRPAPGWSRYRTPIDGYYQCGSGTHPGGCATCAAERGGHPSTREHSARTASGRQPATAQPGGVNWLSVSSAPCGSRMTASLVHMVSADDSTTAPCCSAVATLPSRSATVKRTSHPG